MSIRATSLAVNLAIPALLATLAHRVGGGPWLWWWLFYVNLQLLALLAKDKLAALRKWRRTPETSLLLLALAGASPALLGGRLAFHHKTSKGSFTAQMLGVMAAQVALLWYFWPQLKAFIL